MTCMSQPHQLTNLASDQLKPKLLCRLAFVFPGFVPRMVREAELGVVNGDETPGAKFSNSLTQVFGHGVDLAPVGIVLAIFHNGEVNVGKLLPEAFEAAVVATITREKDLPSR